MELTICLITKGREKYLNSILESFESVLDDPSVHVVIVDNGAPSGVSNRLLSWQRRNPLKVDLMRLEVNEPRPSVLLRSLRDFGVDWVVFPSDDDEFQPEIVTEWRNSLKRKPDLVGLAASAAIMNERGTLTGEVLFPSAMMTVGLNRIASSFHEPPFIWPSLFMRLSKLPEVLPNTRFVFDWWISIQLLLVGEVEVTPSIGINYRVHPGQESFLAPLNRKYFEGLFWLEDLLHSQEFDNWNSKLDDLARIEFWRLILGKKPIYGDPVFSKPLLATIFRKLTLLMKSSDLSKRIAGSYALSNGVFLKDGETKHLIRDSLAVTQPSLGNIRVQVRPGACKDLTEASKLIVGSEESALFHVYCKHSNRDTTAVRIDCLQFFPSHPELNSDLLINELTKHAESQEDATLTITSGERLMITLQRNWKKKLPASIRMLLRKLKSQKY
jgi:hypothetical protein